MPTQTLFLLDDLEDIGRTSELAVSDLKALRAVADWIKTFVVKPHKDLGRAGTVCPFVIVVVFTDLSADRAQGVFAEVLQHLGLPSYMEDGILFGPYYEGNKGTAVYNSSFRPFQSPVPFLFVRHGVISDWKFFLDDEEWLNLWAHRYGESGTKALAEELRRLPWRARRD
jgi:hypothetical protein